MSLQTTNATKCPKCGRAPVKVYTLNNGKKMCGQCMRKAGR